MSRLGFVRDITTAVAVPAGVLASGVLVLEAIAPGIVSRWLNLPALVAACLAIFICGTAFKIGRPQASRRFVFIGSALAAAVALAVAVAFGSRAWSFLLFVLLATVVITTAIIKDDE